MAIWGEMGPNNALDHGLGYFEVVSKPHELGKFTETEHGRPKYPKSLAGLLRNYFSTPI